MNDQEADLLAEPDSASALGSTPELGPLYEPQPVPFTFETIGWSLLAGLLLILLVTGLIIWIQRYIRNRYRREALARLDRLKDGTGSLSDLFVILKGTAITAFGRRRVAELHGHEWLRFLEETGRDVHLVPYEEQILDALYAQREIPVETGEKVWLNAQKWIKTHAGQF